jgi:hypothetical protein
MALTNKELDVILFQWGVTRGPNENDDHLRQRLRAIMAYPQTMNAHYLRLCLLLSRLNVESARRDLPIGDR